MILNSKQKRIFTLAISLFPRKPVCAKKIIDDLACSEATLTRCLRELRELYSLTIKYSKSTHSYQLTDLGSLTNKDVAQMQYAIQNQKKLDEKEVASQTKLIKRSVTLSLSSAAIEKLDQLAAANEKNRSEIIERLICSSVYI
ncbi:MAG: ribbon-helix-helix domain-containing protein [Enterovibrio sp.]